MSKKIKEIDKKRYQKFVEGLRLLDIRIISYKAMVDENFQPPALIALKRTADFKKSKDGMFSVYLDYNLNGTKEGKKKSGVSISATYKLIYKSDMPITDEIFKVFSQTSLRIQVWPYFRQLVQETTSRMGLMPPLILDVIKLTGAI
jgi:preprotein translocase subunit SecB